MLAVLACLTFSTRVGAVSKDAYERQRGVEPTETTSPQRPVPTRPTAPDRPSRPAGPRTGFATSGFAGFGAVADTAGGDSVFYRASEIEYDLRDETIVLIGDAEIHYQDMILTAHRIEFHVKRDIVVAEGRKEADLPDSLAGLPRFASGAEAFTGKRLTYNINTQRGVVEGGISSSTEGVYRGSVVKRTGDEQLDVCDGVFSTCDLDHPHYTFESTNMRILVGDKVIAKPIVLKIADVPILWFPFGVFYIDKDRRSGFLSPRMGENRSQGRYIDGFGYYAAPNDYLGTLAQVAIDERIGYQWRIGTAYALRYRFSGSARYSLTDQWSETSGTRTWTLGWQHRHDLRPRENVTANVNYTNRSTRTSNIGDTQASLYEQFRSDIGYTRTWDAGYSLRARMLLDKNLQTGQTSRTYPDMSIGSGQQYFFEQPRPRGPRAQRATEEQPWWRKVGYSWSWSGRNLIQQGPRDNDLFDVWEYEEDVGDSNLTYQLTLTRYIGYLSEFDGTYTLVRRDEFGVTSPITNGNIRMIPGTADSVRLVSADATPDSAVVRFGVGRDQIIARIPEYEGARTWSRRKIDAETIRTTSQSVRLNLPLPTPRWLNITPSASWSANWRNEPYAVRSGSVTDSATTTHNLQAGIGSSFTTYGTFPINLGPLVAIRHTLTPSASASWNMRRDMAETNYIFGGTHVAGDTTRTIDLGIRNLFQAKTMVRGEERKFDRLLTVDTGIRYNFDADGRKWTDPRTSFQLQPTDYFTSRLTTVHSFYQTRYDSTLNRNVDAGFDWLDPRLMSLSLTSTLNLAGGGRSASRSGTEGFVGQRERGSEERDLERRLLGEEPDPTQIVGSSWQPGWKVDLRHTYSWTRPVSTGFRPKPQNVLDLSLGVSPWEDWDVKFSTHYDFTNRKRTGDHMNIVRRLHCWEAQLDWVMRGTNKGYYFKIYVIGLPDVKVETASANRRSFQ